MESGKHGRHGGITVVAFLMILFGLAEAVTSFTHRQSLNGAVQRFGLKNLTERAQGKRFLGKILATVARRW
jgi:hypothetical protein